MSSDIDTAFDGPWIEPVPGFGDVAFARSDMDYWGSLAEMVKKKKIADDLAKLRTIPVIDPFRKMEMERRIEDQKIFLGEVIDSHQQTALGLKTLIIDSIVRGGRAKDEAEKIRKRIGPGRQMQLAVIICSEPMPTIEQYRDAVRKICRDRAMPADQIARLTDADLIRIANEAPPAPQTQTQAEGDGELFQEAGESPVDQPQTDTQG